MILGLNWSHGEPDIERNTNAFSSRGMIANKKLLLYGEFRMLNFAAAGSPKVISVYCVDHEARGLRACTPPMGH